MKLTILGSGSCLLSQADRASSGYVLEAGEKTILIDSGPVVSKRIEQSDVDREEFDTVVSTHRHPDHISDLIPILQSKLVESLYYDKNGSNDLKFLGPEGHRSYLNSRLNGEMDTDMEEFNRENNFSIDVEILAESQELGNLTLRSWEAEHAGEDFPCKGISIEHKGKKIVFTGDTDYFDQMVDKSEGADLIVADCSMPDEKKVEGHMTPSECGKLAERAGAKKLVLSHLYPDTEDYDLLSSAREVFDGEVVKAEDLMDIEV